MRLKKPKKCYRIIKSLEYKLNSYLVQGKIAIEIKPSVRTVTMGGLRLTLAFPYLIMVVRYGKNYTGKKIQSSCKFQYAQIFVYNKIYRKNMKAKLLRASIISHTDYNSNGSICMGSFGSYFSSVKNLIDEMVSFFWQSPFYMTDGFKLSSATWAANTKKDPKFILSYPFGEHDSNLDEVMEEGIPGDVERLNHEI